MGTLVSVVAMTHNPRIFWNADAASDHDRAAVAEAFATAADTVRAARPDVVIAVANDHLHQFGLDNLPAFAVGTAAEVAGPYWYEREVMHLPEFSGAGQPELAEDVLWGLSEAGIGPSRCAAFRVDHAFTVPLSVVVPDAGIPVVPVFVNTFVPPLPGSGRCFAMGQALRQVIAARPEQERIAVVASFNLSVDVGGPAMGRRHEYFDEQVLSWIAGGEVDRMVRELTPERLVRYGNSTAEFLNYHGILGLVDDRKPDLVWYRLVEAWGGCPVVVWGDLQSCSRANVP
jgi:protocatechuate 4,5-dioxygenase, beta chain